MQTGLAKKYLRGPAPTRPVSLSPLLLGGGTKDRNVYLNPSTIYTLWTKGWGYFQGSLETQKKTTHNKNKKKNNSLAFKTINWQEKKLQTFLFWELMLCKDLFEASWETHVKRK